MTTEKVKDSLSHINALTPVEIGELVGGVNKNPLSRCLELCQGRLQETKEPSRPTPYQALPTCIDKPLFWGKD